MSSVQRRCKNIIKVPSLNMTENHTDNNRDDPRSPSANISRCV